MKEELTIVKVGGAVLENEKKCAQFLDAFARIEGKKMLVHGGGKTATKLAETLGIEVEMVEGRRVTNDQMIEVVIMTYTGLNKKLVSQLQKRGLKSIGLTGADGDCIYSQKRPQRNGIDFGWVGDIKKVSSQFLSGILKNDMIPVLAPLTHDGNGHLLNTNADSVASTVASALSVDYSTTLNFIFDQKGVMKNLDDADSLIKVIDFHEYQNLKKQSFITDGLIPKLDNAFDTLSKGVSKVRLLETNALSQLQNPEFDEYTTIH